VKTILLGHGKASVPAPAVSPVRPVRGATCRRRANCPGCRRAPKPNSTIRAGAISGRGWKRPFEDPTPLPRGRDLVTLEDAGNYITKLPKAEHEAPEWQAAMEALMLVAKLGGPTMFARIGVMRALNHGKPKPKAAPRVKRTKAFRIIR
jgi:hypothetical protein